MKVARVSVAREAAAKAVVVAVVATRLAVVCGGGTGAEVAKTAMVWMSALVGVLAVLGMVAGYIRRVRAPLPNVWQRHFFNTAGTTPTRKL